uniref:Uncharacterized protein n=1 Tax=Opuntia streptacantha TaxID=393608 RepID=A0A7C8YK86_OPUST
MPQKGSPANLAAAMVVAAVAMEGVATVVAVALVAAGMEAVVLEGLVDHHMAVAVMVEGKITAVVVTEDNKVMVVAMVGVLQPVDSMAVAVAMVVVWLVVEVIPTLVVTAVVLMSQLTVVLPIVDLRIPV